MYILEPFPLLIKLENVSFFKKKGQYELKKVLGQFSTEHIYCLYHVDEHLSNQHLGCFEYGIPFTSRSRYTPFFKCI